jgi:phosphoglycolate phosphatase-like HAD superfamily hydrolase
MSSEGNDMPKDVKLVIFDSDGTLVNTIELIVQGFLLTLLECGFEDKANIDWVRANLGGPVEQCMARIIGQPEDSAAVKMLRATLETVQDEHCKKWVTAYPGVPETIAALHDANVGTAIWTSGTPHHITRNLGAVELEHM